MTAPRRPGVAPPAESSATKSAERAKRPPSRQLDPMPVDVPQTTRPMALDLEHNKALRDRDALPPPAGYMYTPDGRLVPIANMRMELSDPAAREIFCKMLEVTGSMRAACDVICNTMPEVKRAMLYDPDFAEEVEASADRHRQSLYAHAVQRATVGYEVPIIGGRDKDQVVGYERRVSDSLLTLLLKRHFTEFRESKATFVKVDNRTLNVNPGQTRTVKDLSRTHRDALRLLLKDPPTEIDPTGMEGDAVLDTSCVEIPTIKDPDVPST